MKASMKRTGGVRRYVILNRCRQQQRLVARVTLDIRHARSIRRAAARGNRARDFSHGLVRVQEWRRWAGTYRLILRCVPGFLAGAKLCFEAKPTALLKAK